MGQSKKRKQTTRPIESFIYKSSKWQELANLLARKNRSFSILKDFENDPNLKKIHEQKNKIFQKTFKKIE
jgi:hypothetical protein